MDKTTVVLSSVGTVFFIPNKKTSAKIPATTKAPRNASREADRLTMAHWAVSTAAPNP